MSRPEPVIAAYELSDWCDPTVADRRKEPVKYSRFPSSRQATAYRGLLRRDPADMPGYAEAEPAPAPARAGLSELAAQAGVTVTPQESGQAEGPASAPEAPEAADAAASSTSDPFTGPPAPGWGGEGITPAGARDPRASHPDHVDPHPGDATGSATETEGDNR